MSKINHPEQQDRITTHDDEKKRILDLYGMQLVPPDGVDIFDEPTRCYRINKQWAKIAMGMVMQLLEVAPWRDAQHEGYAGIEQIARFLVGEDCMSFELRQKPTDTCILQQSLDGGETWTDVFDFSLCLTEQLAPINSSITSIYQQTLVNEGFSPSESTPSDYYTPQEMADLGVEADACDTAGKDAIYGAVNTVVRYIHNRNVDILQQVSQAAGVPDQVARLISAIPGVGLAPIDEVFSYVAFLVDELTDEYNATVDEDLLQSVVCDLFCICVANGCTLDFNDVYNYFAGKVDATFSATTSTLLNFMQFAISGTFAGDDYFYVMCFFQLTVAGLGQKFGTVEGMESYALQARAGLNTPDNDWSIFCVDCPDFEFWSYEWNFALGLGDFEFQADGGGDLGQVVAAGLKSVPRVGGGETHEFLWVLLNFAVAYDIETIDAFWLQEVVGSGSANSRTYTSYANPDAVSAIAVFLNSGYVGSPTPVDWKDCNELGTGGTWNSRSLTLHYSTEEGTPQSVTLKKVRIVGRDNGNGKPVGAIWHETIPDCDTFTL